MTDVDQTPSGVRADLNEHSRTGMGAPALQRAITDHIRYSIGRPAAALRPEHYYRALALAVRDRMQDRRVASTQTSLDLGRKVTCFPAASVGSRRRCRRTSKAAPVRLSMTRRSSSHPARTSRPAERVCRARLAWPSVLLTIY